jgi:hypothetical protein
VLFKFNNIIFPSDVIIYIYLKKKKKKKKKLDEDTWGLG